MEAEEGVFMAKIATMSAKNGTVGRTQASSNNSDQTAIEKLAYQFFVDRGYEHGHQEEDWLRAEAIIKNRKRL